jgi:hypothetical protein
MREPVDVGARMRVDALSAMKSERRREGAHYLQLRECRFGATAPSSLPRTCG